MEPNKNEIKIELTPEVAKGIYSNLAVITHGPNEFFLDFITMAPNMPQAKVQSRIIMSPRMPRTSSAPSWRMSRNTRQLSERSVPNAPSTRVATPVRYPTPSSWAARPETLSRDDIQQSYDL